MQVLGLHINDFTLPDVNLIGEHADAAELGRMLQLILGCAVNCEQKQGVCVFSGTGGYHYELKWLKAEKLI